MRKHVEKNRENTTTNESSDSHRQVRSGGRLRGKEKHKKEKREKRKNPVKTKTLTSFETRAQYLYGETPEINVCGTVRQKRLISYVLCDDAQPILFFRS